MAKGAFASPTTLILTAAAVVGVAYLLKRRSSGGLREIPSSAVPPAYPPGGGLGAAPSLGASRDVGEVDLNVLFDPKIVVLRPGGTAELKAWKAVQGANSLGDRGGNLMFSGHWAGPSAGNWWLGGGMGLDPDARTGLYNVGGPSRDKLQRRVEEFDWDTSSGEARPKARNLIVRAPADWGPSDWAQIRLYRADAVIGDVDRDEQPDGVVFERWPIEQVRIRTDLLPVQIVWIMGAN